MRPDISWLASQQIREPLKPFGILFNETREQKMINVLTVHPFDTNANTEDEDHWVCYEWPQQSIVVGGVGGPYTTRGAVIEAFVDMYNAIRDTNLVESDFRFFGPLMASVEMRKMPDDAWNCWATSDRLYSASGPTLIEAQARWIQLYNEEYVTPNNGTQLTEENIDWVLVEE